MAKGAEIMVDYLIEQGVDHLFGVCGHGIIGFLDAAFDRRDEIETITTHDERIAGFMADAYYRVTGKKRISKLIGNINVSTPTTSRNVSGTRTNQKPTH